MKVFLACVVTCVMFMRVTRADLTEVFSWKLLDYAFPTQAIRQQHVESKNFIPLNNVPVGLEVWGDRVFVTVPRWKTGVPASLSYFRVNDSTSSPFLTPYPDWESHNILAPGFRSLPTRIVSPFRMRADRCGRLWVLDTGLADIFGSSVAYYPTTLLVFDLRSDTLLRRYTFPKEHIRDTTFFANIAVDVGTGCDNAFAYSADLGAFGLVVYDWKNNSSWRVSHNYFLSNPLEGEYNVQGMHFQWTDGLFGLALSKASRETGERTLYFHPFSSSSEFQVSTRVLNNATTASSSFHEFKFLGTRGPNTQSSASFMDEESGIIFYTQVNLNAVSCWNSRTHPKYEARSLGVVKQDNVTMVFPNDLKVDHHGSLWVLTDRMPAFLYGTDDAVNVNDINFRILKATVKDAVKGTVCSPDYIPLPEPEVQDNEDELSNRFGDKELPRCKANASNAAVPVSAIKNLVLNIVTLVLVSSLLAVS